jgi:glycosyltransferase involved in cell wall biosynthesis
MKHRLLIVTLNGDPLVDLGSEHAGGQCKYVLELSKNLILQGWHVHVVTLAGAARPEEETVTYGLTVSRIKRPTGSEYGYDITEDEIADIGAELNERLRSDILGFRAILACYWISALAALPIAKSRGWPLVITFCALAQFKMAADPSPQIARRAEIEADLGRRCHAVIATNRSEAVTLADVYGIDRKKIHVIPRGVDLTLFSDVEPI